jgi:hypothetical protein
MKKNPVAHTHQVNSLFTVTLAVVDRFNREVIQERFRRVMKCDAMVTPVYLCFGVIPFKNIVLHDGAGCPLSGLTLRKLFLRIFLFRRLSDSEYANGIGHGQAHRGLCRVRLGLELLVDPHMDHRYGRHGGSLLSEVRYILAQSL